MKLDLRYLFKQQILEVLTTTHLIKYYSFLLVVKEKYCKAKINEFIFQEFMPGRHGGIMRWLSSMLTNVLQVRSQPGTDNFVLSVCCCVRFQTSLRYHEHSYSYGELTVWIVFPVILRQKYIKKGYFLNTCFLRCRLESEIRFWGRHRKSDFFSLFFIENDNGGPVGNRGF